MVIDKEKILGLAQKYILKGQSKKAIKEYLKLIEASPKDKRLHLKLGDLYLKDGDKEKAIKEYLKLAELYTEEDLNFRAISIYKKVLSIDSKNVDALHKIAKLYIKEGLIGNAKNCYQSILEIKPNDKEALEGLKSIEIQPGKKGPLKGAHHTETTITKPRQVEKVPSQEIKPQEVPPIPNIPPTITQPEVEKKEPDKDLEMHYHLGIAYKEMELYDYAISEFEQAAKDPHIKFDCYIMLGNCFMEKGNYNKSIEYYKLASEIKGLSDNKLARLYYHLALAYEANGMIPEAIDTFTNVLKLDSSLIDAKERLEKLQQSLK